MVFGLGKKKTKVPDLSRYDQHYENYLSEEQRNLSAAAAFAASGGSRANSLSGYRSNPIAMHTSPGGRYNSFSGTSSNSYLDRKHALSNSSAGTLPRSNSMRQQQARSSSLRRNSLRNNSLTSNSSQNVPNGAVLVKTVRKTDSTGRTMSLTTQTVKRMGAFEVVKTTTVGDNVNCSGDLVEEEYMYTSDGDVTGIRGQGIRSNSLGSQRKSNVRFENHDFGDFGDTSDTVQHRPLSIIEDEDSESEMTNLVDSFNQPAGPGILKTSENRRSSMARTPSTVTRPAVVPKQNSSEKSKRDYDPELYAQAYADAMRDIQHSQRTNSLHAVSAPVTPLKARSMSLRQQRAPVKPVVVERQQPSYDDMYSKAYQVALDKRAHAKADDQDDMMQKALEIAQKNMLLRKQQEETQSQPSKPRRNSTSSSFMNFMRRNSLTSSLKTEGTKTQDPKDESPKVSSPVISQTSKLESPTSSKAPAFEPWRLPKIEVTSSGPNAETSSLISADAPNMDPPKFSVGEKKKKSFLGKMIDFSSRNMGYQPSQKQTASMWTNSMQYSENPTAFITNAAPLTTEKVVDIKPSAEKSADETSPNILITNSQKPNDHPTLVVKSDDATCPVIASGTYSTPSQSFTEPENLKSGDEVPATDGSNTISTDGFEPKTPPLTDHVHDCSSEKRLTEPVEISSNCQSNVSVSNQLKNSSPTIIQGDDPIQEPVVFVNMNREGSNSSEMDEVVIITTTSAAVNPPIDMKPPTVDEAKISSVSIANPPQKQTKLRSSLRESTQSEVLSNPPQRFSQSDPSRRLLQESTPKYHQRLSNSTENTRYTMKSSLRDQLIKSPPSKYNGDSDTETKKKRGFFSFIKKIIT